MAKSKYATALFEVMNRQKSAAAAAAANGKGGHTGSMGLSAPKWWFKSRNNSDVKTMSPGENSISSAVAEPPSPRPSSSSSTMVPPLASSIDVSQVNPAAPAPRVQPVAVSVDPDRQQISLSLYYTS